MSKHLPLTIVSVLTAVLASMLLSVTTPLLGARTAEAQTCCNPPIAPWPTARWPKNTVVRVKLQADVFDEVEVDAIKAAFSEWNARSLNTCSNITYPEPYEFVDAPPSAGGDVFYVRYDGEFTAPQPGITTANGSGSVINYAQTTLFRNMRELGLPQFKGAFVKGVMLHEIGHEYGLDHFRGGCSSPCSAMCNQYSNQSTPTACDDNVILGIYCQVAATPTPTPTPTPGAYCDALPDYYGNCPAGTYPNSCGRCCSEAVRSACYSQGWYFNSVDGECRAPSDMCWDQQYECMGWQSWNSFACGCTDPCTPSPVLIDIWGDGFDLTDSAGGVFFDINGDGTAERLSWTAAGSDDAWLVLDRDGDGVINGGAEMFGNFTYQPHAPADGDRNGFLALAEFDRPASGDNGGMGGDGDGLIDEQDAVFPQLRLWQDANHNGVSEARELHTLGELGVSSISLDYKEARRRDRYGNQFRYQSPVAGADKRVTRRLAYDVFLVSGR